MSVDTIGNFLTSIRNAIARAKSSVEVPYSRTKYAIAQMLCKEGYIRDVKVVGEVPKQKLIILLKYVENESVIHEIKQVSKPGRRVYVQHSCIPTVIGGLGIAIMTTNKGIMTNKAARDNNIGGEVICTIW